MYKMNKKCAFWGLTVHLPKNTAIGVGKYENNKKKICSPRVFNKYIATQ